MLGQIGKNDSQADSYLQFMSDCNVDISLIQKVANTPTGQAFIFTLPCGENSIIIEHGANGNYPKN